MVTEALQRLLPAWIRARRPWRLLLGLMLAVVSWFAFAPMTFNDGGLPLDKVRHLMAFSALAWVAVQGFGMRGKDVLRIALALLAYGVFIELVQSRIPGRFASSLDVLADLIGIAIGLLVARFFSVAR